MAALPYMQLYVSDYLADTMHLTTEEHGAYLLLIFNYWQTGKPIPKSRLARIARLSNERWSSVEVSLNEFFNDNGETWEHERIERDLDMVRAGQNQRSAAGKASAEARKAKKETKRQRDGNDRSTSVEIPLNESSTIKDTDTDTDTDTEQKKKISGSPDGAPAADAAKPDAATVKSERLAQVTADAIAAYNATLGKPHGQLAAVHLVNEVRQNQVKRCLGVARAICERTLGAPTISAEFWRDYFAECKRDPFKNGDGPYTGSHANWRPDFEYLTRKDVMTTLFDRAMSEAT